MREQKMRAKPTVHAIQWSAFRAGGGKLMEDIEKIANNKIPFIEAFRTIEGEGSHIGVPKILFRVAGCAVGCFGCDTVYSWHTAKRGVVTVNEALKSINQENRQPNGARYCNEVAITGGEPLHYPQQMFELIKGLKTEGYFVSMETSGLIEVDPVFQILDFISFDVKTPSSKVIIHEDNILFLKRAWEKYPSHIKAVITNKDDLLFLEKHFLRELLSRDYSRPIILTPAAGKQSSPAEIMNKINIITDWNRSYNIRVVAQQHVLLNYK